MARRTKNAQITIHGVPHHPCAEGSGGRPPGRSDVCREYGVLDAAHYHWKAKYGGMEVSDIKWLKTLGEEN